MEDDDIKGMEAMMDESRQMTPEMLEEMQKALNKRFEENMKTQFGDELFYEFIETKKALREKYPKSTEFKVVMITGMLMSSGFGNSEETAECLRNIADMITSPVNQKIQAKLREAESKKNAANMN